MGRQTFGFCQRHGGPGQLGEGIGVALDQRGALEEIIDRQARTEPSRAAGRQDVIGARHIVADSFGRMASQKDRPGMADPVRQALWLLNRELDMFRRDQIDQRRAVLQRTDHHRPVIAPRGSRILARRQTLELDLNGRADRIGKGRIIRDQDRLRGATDRAIFARGALRAALWGQAQKPGEYDMADVLGLK